MSRGSGSKLVTGDRNTTLVHDFVVGHEYEVIVRAVGPDGTQQAMENAARNTIVIVGKLTAPATPAALTTSGFLNAISLSWTNPDDNDFDYMEIWRSSTGDRATSVKIAEVKGVTYLDALGLSNVSRYYWIRAINTSTVPSGFSARTIGTSLGVLVTDIDDFAVTASKFFTKIPVVDGDSWSDDSPGGGSIAWNAHSLYYNGAKHNINAANTADKYVYWTLSNPSNYQTSNTAPTQVDTLFIVATNVSGTHNVAWNSIANQVIGSAYILDAAIVEAKIDNLAVTTAKIDSLAVTTGKINSLAVTTAKINTLAVTNAKINDLNATKITAGDIAVARITAQAANAVNGGVISISAAKINIAGTTAFSSGWAGASNAESDINVLNTTNAPADAGATDDTAATAAQSTADSAQGDATSNIALLADIAADDKITPVEKFTIKPLWDAIVAEKSDIDTQADTYSVSKTAYGNAYTTLNTYLNTTINVFGNMTTTSTITRATWDTAWEGYFNAKIEILQAIADAIQTNAANAQSTADAAQSTADSKAKVFRQDAEPGAGMVSGDVWIDTNDGNRPYSYSGAAWVETLTIIDGGKITTGTIDAAVVTVVNLDADRITAGTISAIPYETGVGVIGCFLLPDANTGIRVSHTGYKVFEVLIGGADIGDVYIGNYDGGAGCLWDQSETKFIIKGILEIAATSSGYANISDKPGNLSDVNAGEGTKLTGIEALADVTGTNQALTIASQGALATQSSVNLASGEVTNKNADNIAETAGKKWAGRTGADITSENIAADTVLVQGETILVTGKVATGFLTADNIQTGTLSGIAVFSKAAGNRVYLREDGGNGVLQGWATAVKNFEIRSADGDADFAGDVNAGGFEVGANIGQTGSFVDNNGNTVTVTGGIITDFGT